jgi:hypothetical protein
MSLSREELYIYEKKGLALPFISAIILLITSKLPLNFTNISALITKYYYRGIIIYKF